MCHGRRRPRLLVDGAPGRRGGVVELRGRAATSTPRPGRGRSLPLSQATGGRRGCRARRRRRARPSRSGARIAGAVHVVERDTAVPGGRCCPARRSRRPARSTPAGTVNRSRSSSFTVQPPRSIGAVAGVVQLEPLAGVVGSSSAGFCSTSLITTRFGRRRRTTLGSTGRSPGRRGSSSVVEGHQLDRRSLPRRVGVGRARASGPTGTVMPCCSSSGTSRRGPPRRPRSFDRITRSAPFVEHDLVAVHPVGGDAAVHVRVGEAGEHHALAPGAIVSAGSTTFSEPAVGDPSSRRGRRVRVTDGWRARSTRRRES